MTPLLDPRDGDIEDDASSTQQRSLLSLAGSLLAEVSLPKLLVAWAMLIGLPGLMVGFLPLLVSLWVGKVSTQLPLVLTGFGSLLLLAALLTIGWLGGRVTLRMIETNFWSLHALGIQPSYVVGREALRHVAERRLNPGGDSKRRGHIRARAALASALLLSLFAAGVALLAWPYTHWTASLADVADPLRLVWPVIANAVTIVACYFCVAALLWGIGDALMPPPVDLGGFATPLPGARQWRIAHLSDVHTVAGPYGFRIESGRSGPRGNQRLAQVFARLAAIHAAAPLDAILISGDLTDAGSATEWAAFFDLLDAHPQLKGLVLGLPGNHDLNIVDRANPARLDLPGSPLKRLRQMRALSAFVVLQGERARIFDAAADKLGPSHEAFLSSYRDAITDFADSGSLRLSRKLSDVAALSYPMVLLPDSADSLGIMLLDSNASTHFSFTNALGMISLAQLHAIDTVTAQFPQARWIIALHHHLVEYPTPATALSERIGTALINGSYVVRRLRRLGGRAIFMHGHRHTEWFGRVGDLVIISAPSPVMNATDGDTTHFFIHTVSTDAVGNIALLTPEKIELRGI